MLITLCSWAYLTHICHPSTNMFPYPNHLPFFFFASAVRLMGQLAGCLLSVAAVDLFPASWASWSIYYLARATKGIIWNLALRGSKRVRRKNREERERGDRYRGLIEFCNDLSPPFASLSGMLCVEQKLFTHEAAQFFWAIVRHTGLWHHFHFSSVFFFAYGTYANKNCNETASRPYGYDMAVFPFQQGQ